MSSPDLLHPAVLEELEKVLSSNAFRGAGRSGKLLRFLVEETVAGRSDRLKDYTLGAEALGRGDDFDPRTDPIARVEASRLRSRLELYFATEGAADPLVITLPKGGYVPLFEKRPVGEGLPGRTPEPARRNRLAWLVVPPVVLAALVWSFWPAGPAPEPASAYEMRLEIQTPPTTDPLSQALSPDGRRIVFVASSKGRSQLWLRHLDSEASRPLAGTENASLPFWSPDSQSIAFFADSLLKRIDLESGLVRTLTRVVVAAGGAWNKDGIIIYPMVPDSPLFQVSDKGGPGSPLTGRLPGQTGHRGPHFLPDGHRFLYYAMGGPDVRGIYVGDLKDPNFSRKLAVETDTPAVYASGHLWFLLQGKLFAHGFDADRLELTGNSHPVAASVAVGGSAGLPALSASANGLVAYRTGTSGKRQLVWFDRFGKELQRLGEPADFGRGYISIAPGDRRAATQRTVDGNTDIWLLDTGQGGGPVKFTSGSEPDIAPIWSPGGDSIVFSSPSDGVFNLYRQQLTSSEREAVWVSKQSKQATDWARGILLVRSLDPETDWDIWAVTMDGSREPVPIVRTNYEERDARFSPDGRWIAYQSNESGRFEIYVRPYPGPGEPKRISMDGGTNVTWGPEGRELFYLTLDGTLVAAAVTLGSNGKDIETIGPPVSLFFANVSSTQDLAKTYVLSSDGKRVLVDAMVEDAAPPITLILNWKP